jgi:hypothetical protein
MPDELPVFIAIMNALQNHIAVLNGKGELVAGN